jgi:putative ABC transport system substrate-binding protein
MAVDLSEKHLALLKEAVPNLSRVALVIDATYPFKERIITSNEKAARELRISLWPVEISGPDYVEPVFPKTVADRASGFALKLGSLLFNLRARIAASALAHHLPGICFIARVRRSSGCASWRLLKTSGLLACKASPNGSTY